MKMIYKLYEDMKEQREKSNHQEKEHTKENLN